MGSQIPAGVECGIICKIFSFYSTTRTSRYCLRIMKGRDIGGLRSEEMASIVGTMSKKLYENCLNELRNL